MLARRLLPLLLGDDYAGLAGVGTVAPPSAGTHIFHTAAGLAFTIGQRAAGLASTIGQKSPGTAFVIGQQSIGGVDSE